MERGDSSLKKILLFIICLIPWFLSSLIPIDLNFYNSLKLPFFTPPPIFYSIAWTITYIGIAISIYILISECTWTSLPKSYKKTLLLNYLLNQLFTVVFFYLHSIFLGFVTCIGTFITCLFLYEETANLSEKSTKYLNPYVLLSLFATILSLTIYIINTLP